ncbi:DUF4224 domain-containing protein [Paraburkholderia rhynchosiae]|uniref:DUF4224 domain-containing protein n=1 Tax=Paraburkholderia rhynchosiae TaxID=487049 RepID=A0A2N7W963_9BURK|nr:DUF4224 domain-containing protein [Paraburkholderia rhynchosiae]PMS25946.1 hypothetical protein C0Z16_27815 [Paraburkholderia rhynchosiae]CAB3730327.1 hypothetical protein LMG27174_05734 [Paraburkholderia rhynchosiae]
MDTRLMSDQDLIDVTGKKRHSAQAAWFERHFGITPVQRADGRIILTWAAFEGLQAKRAGVGPATSSANTERPPLMPIRRAA